MDNAISPRLDKSRIGKLDSVRGIAALMVLVGHCGLPFAFDRSGSLFWLQVLWAGGSAVVMFFLLSGYVLALQLRSPRRPSYAGFVIRRFLRIWPAFAVTIVSAYLILVALDVPSLQEIVQGLSRVPSFRDLLENLAMVGNPFAIDGPVWTLFIEMRLSIVFPLLFLISYRFNFFSSAAISIVLSIAGSRMVHFDMSEVLTSAADSSRYLCLFVIGAALAHPGNTVAKIYPVLPQSVKAVGFACALGLLSYQFLPLAVPAKNYVSWIGVTLLFIFCLYSKSADRILDRPWLLFLGRISYGLYLVHYPILQVSNAYLPKEWALLTVLPSSVLLGWIINVLVEQPMIQLGRRLSPPFAKKV